MSDNVHIAATLLTAKKGKEALDLAQATASKVDQLVGDLATLARQPGPRGEAGSPGRDGRDGAPGRDGADGLPPAHEWQGTKLRFKQPDGQWGKAVDLKGAPGEPGKDRKTIIVRGGGASVAPVTPGKDGIDLTGLIGMQGGQLVSLSAQQFAAYITGALDMSSNYSRRSDFVGDTIIYRGEAAPGTPEDSPAWRIKRIEFTLSTDGNQDVIEKWAGGTDALTHAWIDRAALTYL